MSKFVIHCEEKESFKVDNRCSILKHLHVVIQFLWMRRLISNLLAYSLQILRDLGVRTMKLMTNNPAKYIGLKGYGLEVIGRVPLLSPITFENKRYLETKRSKMGHIYGSEFNGRLGNLISSSGITSTKNPSDAVSNS